MKISIELYGDANDILFELEGFTTKLKERVVKTTELSEDRREIAYLEEGLAEAKDMLRQRDMRIAELEQHIANALAKPAVVDELPTTSVEPVITAFEVVHMNKSFVAKSLPAKYPDNGGNCPPGVWLMTNSQFKRLERITLIEHLGGWVQNLIHGPADYVKVVLIPDGMPKTGNLTSYLREHPTK